MSVPQITDCHVAMQNVVKAARLLWLFTKRMKDAIRIIENTFGCDPYITVPYPLNSLTMYPGYDKCDSVFASVWRKIYRPKPSNIIWQQPGYKMKRGADLFEIIVRTDPDYVTKNYQEVVCSNENEKEPDMILRAYKYLGSSPINPWDGVYRPYFEEFYSGIKHQRNVKSVNGTVEIYEEVFNFCDALGDEEAIRKAAESFRENANKALGIKIFEETEASDDGITGQDQDLTGQPS